VYFTARVDPELPKGLVVRVSRDGGAPVELATGQLSPDRLYVTETDVYWTNFHADGGVYRVARSGQGKVQDVAPGQRGAIGVTVDATHVYWVADGQLRQLAIGATGPGDPVTSTVYDTPSFVVHDATSSYLFVSELASLGRVRRIAIDGGQDDILVEGQGSPNALAIQGDVLFFSTMTDAGAVHSVPTAGGGVTVIRNGLIQPAGIAVDDTYVYWASFIEKGTVARARIDGSGPVEVLADGQDWPNGVAVDEAFVYWTNHVEGGTVMKVAKEAAAQ
jgi:sugar lactone lactonase YvrE